MRHQTSIFTKRVLTILVLLINLAQANAVLREKDLTHTLGVLKQELKSDFDKQKQLMQRFEAMNAEQHAKLINFMKRSEQIGLVLYSQKADFSFDMAYACQQATELHNELKMNTMPYDRILQRINQEVERYTELVALLKQMPPAIGEARDSITAVDSMMISEADSLAAAHVHPAEVAEEDAHDEPFFLSKDEIKDRKECLFFAAEILKSLETFYESVLQEQTYYDQISERTVKLNTFAQSRYKILQQGIFKDGGRNYFSLLLSLPRPIEQIQRDVDTKYRPLSDQGTGVSEWRGMYVLFISVFMILYITLSTVISMVVLRWLLPKRWRTEDFLKKRRMYTIVLGVGLFAIIVSIARQFTDRNVVLMATSLMITFTLLLEVIYLSMLIRLDTSQMKNGAKIYNPFIFIALVVIVFRIILIPNSLVNLTFPPILLLCTIWQMRTLKKHRGDLPHADMFYSTISLVAMIIATVASWAGYTLLAVEIMMWWMFQLTFIQSITFIYYQLKLYENKKLIFKLMPQLKADKKAGIDTSEQEAQVIARMKKGEYISKTWIYDFGLRALVPILAVLSVLLSIYFAADIFEMTSVCIDIFLTNFIEQQGVISLSLAKIVLVACSWYMFRYFNYVLKSLYHHIRRKTLGDSKEDYNGTLANNIITIVVWGGYCIFILVMLRVPSTGISIVTGGLATGMGFAMKDLLENFFYGLSLMSGRVRVGDYVECDGVRGRVEKITYQSTMIYTMDGCVIAFLNSSLFNKNFKNLTRNHQYELIKIPVGVAYGSNMNEVRSMLENALLPLKDRVNPAGKKMIDENSKITVAFNNFGDNSVDLLICMWMLVEESITLTCQAKEIVYNTLNENNINIPFPQRDIYVHQVEK